MFIFILLLGVECNNSYRNNISNLSCAANPKHQLESNTIPSINAEYITSGDAVTQSPINNLFYMSGVFKMDNYLAFYHLLKSVI